MYIRARRLVMLALLALGQFSACAVTMTPYNASAPPDGVVHIAIPFTDTTDNPTTIVGKLAFDPAQCAPIGGELLGPARNAGAQFDSNIVGNEYIFVLFGLGIPAFGPSDTLHLYFRLAPTAFGTFTIAQSGGSASNSQLGDLLLSIGDFEVEVLNLDGQQHSADSNGDWAIDLDELLRVIQFYNSPGYHCQVGTEDGYATDRGDESCPPHDSDYVPQDWTVSLDELLRAIQFYNFVGNSYHPATEPTEDGFAAGPF